MKKILLLGDSISLHYREYLFKMCEDIASFEPNRAEIDWIKSMAGRHPGGLNCGDSRRMLEKLETYLGQQLFGAGLVLLNCGLHDQKKSWEDHTHQVELAQYRENLLAIIDLAGRERLCWITTTPVVDGRHDHASFNRLEADHAAYLEVANQIMANAGIPVIDLCTFTCGLEKETRYSDKVHYSPESRKLQAAFIAGNLFAMRG